MAEIQMVHGTIDEPFMFKGSEYGSSNVRVFQYADGSLGLDIHEQEGWEYIDGSVNLIEHGYIAFKGEFFCPADTVGDDIDVDELLVRLGVATKIEPVNYGMNTGWRMQLNNPYLGKYEPHKFSLELGAVTEETETVVEQRSVGLQKSTPTTAESSYGVIGAAKPGTNGLSGLGL